MSIQGTLDSMSLQEILSWAASNNETGVLELERNKVRRRIAFDEGRVVGCSSDDPPARIGQFLLSRGKITKEALAKALEYQKEHSKTLGEILQDMGELEAEEFAYELSAKAEENIYSLFDWSEAVFRFKNGEPNDPWLIDYHAPLEEILERGTERREQLDAIRRLFSSSGVVLAHGSARIPPAVRQNGLVARIVDSIDGEKTIGEVLYHAHASEFLVLKFLASAVFSDFLTISEVRPVDPQYPTLLDQRPAQASGTFVSDRGSETNPAPMPEAELAAPPRAPESTFEDKIELAQHFLAQEKAQAALDVLDDCYEERPGDDFLGHVIRQAESMFLKQCRDGDFQSHFVPAPVDGREHEPPSSSFSAAEKFLMGIMGENHTIQMLSWIAPLRETDIYRALARLKSAGIIELREPVQAASGNDVPRIEWA